MLLPVDCMDREDMLGGIDRDAFEFHSGGLSWQFHRPNVGTFDAVGPSTPTDGFRRTGPKHGCGMGLPLHQAGFPVRQFDRLPSLAIASLLLGEDERSGSLRRSPVSRVV